MLKAGTLIFFLFGGIAGYADDSIKNYACPKSPEEWSQKRDNYIVNLLSPWSGPNSSKGFYYLQALLNTCQMNAGALTSPIKPEQKCMKALADLLGEFTRPMAADADGKYTSVPDFLQDPKLVHLLDSKQLGEAKRYIDQVIAKKPGVPPLLAEAFRGTIDPPNKKPGQDRFVVKFTDSNGLTKWVNFAVPGPNQDGAAENISVLAIDAKNQVWLGDNTKIVSESGLKISSLPETKDCRLCHIQGYISIPYDQRVTWNGMLDRSARSHDFEALAPLNRGRSKFMGENGTLIENTKFGPGVGSGAKPTTDFVEGCFKDILQSGDPADMKLKPEVEKTLNSANLFAASKIRIQQNMNCSSCHNSSREGALTFPFGIGIESATKKSFHLARIYSGSMPADDYGDLTEVDRRVLGSCLFKDLYGYPAGGQPRLADIKNGKFYRYLTGIDCKTGLAKEPSANIFAPSGKPPEGAFQQIENGAK